MTTSVEATSEDLPGAHRLLRAQFAEISIAVEDASLERGLSQLLATPSLGRVVLAMDGKAAIGIAVLAFTWTLEHGGLVAWLDELYVIPERRGRGVGTLLLRDAVAIAEAAGCSAIELEVETSHCRAEALYHREGWQPLPRARWSRRIAGQLRRGLLPALEPVDHISLGVNELPRSKAFYDSALAPLGFAPHVEIDGEIGYFKTTDRDHKRAFALYIGFEDPGAKHEVLPSVGFHVAFRAHSREAVDRFYEAALGAGGRDNGPPGVRAKYHADYYGAFVLDPDGHHIEAVCHEPEISAGDLGTTASSG